MDNEVKEILMQLVDTTNKLAEGQKRTDEHFKQIDERFDKIENDITDIKKDISDMKEDIAEIKYEAGITRNGVNRNGEILEQMIKDLAPLNLLNVKYE